MKKKYVLGLMSLFIFFTFYSSTYAIVDPPGDNSGPVDLLSADAVSYDRGDVVLLKILIETTPHLPGVIIFEADVDNSTGTGGSISTIGVPVPPCPCKTEPGFDIVVSIFTRQQGDSSGSAIAASCTDNQGTCGRRRESGEWYAITSQGGRPIRAIGILRSYLDPVPHAPESAEMEDCYTIPWSHIIAYANAYQNENTPGAARILIGLRPGQTITPMVNGRSVSGMMQMLLQQTKMTSLQVPSPPRPSTSMILLLMWVRLIPLAVAVQAILKG